MSELESMEEEPGSPGPPPLEDQNGMEVTAPVQRSARAIQAEINQRLMRERERKRLNLTALNPYIVCALCKGYLIDPVTVVECLHSFCKSCIVKHVEKSKYCPTCDTQIHKTKPLLSLRADKALQDIVYRVVPGLYRAEMRNRVRFYSAHPEAEPASQEDAGEVTDRLFFSPEDDISMSIEYFDNYSKTADDINRNRMAPPPASSEENNSSSNNNPNRRFLQCPGSVTIQHLKKFIMTKYGLDSSFLVDVLYREDLLPEDLTLIDVAYSYDWRKTSPMRFYYRIYQKTKILTRKRKKKRTRATSGHQQPAAKKLRTLDSGSAAAVTWNGTGPPSGPTTTTAAATTASVSVAGRGSSGGQDDRMDTTPPVLSSSSVASTASGKAAGGEKAPGRADKAVASSAAHVVSAEAGKKVAATAENNKRPLPVAAPTVTAAPLCGVPPKSSPSDVKKAAKSAASAPPAEVAAKVPSASSGGGGGSKAGGGPTEAASSGKSVTSVATTSRPISASSLSSQQKTASTPVKTAPAVGANVTAQSPKAANTSSAAKPAATIPPPVASKPRPSLAAVAESAKKGDVISGAVIARKDSGPAPLNGQKAEVAPASKKPETEVKNKVMATSGVDKAPSSKLTMTASEKKNKLTAAATAATSGPANNKEVVEISVEVSASDVKKVLEKKRAEKDAAAAAAAKQQQQQQLIVPSGEERLYSNYSIVDQIKKAGTAASLARQQVERASMMDFARSSEALAANAVPRVPPIIQGLQPRLPPPPAVPQTSSSSSNSNNTETTVLSAIVQSLTQKQQKMSQATTVSQDGVTRARESPPARTVAAVSSRESTPPVTAVPPVSAASDLGKRTSPKPNEPAAKTIGAIVAPALNTGKVGGLVAQPPAIGDSSSESTPKLSKAGPAAITTTPASTTAASMVMVPKLPGSTSIQAVSRVVEGGGGKTSPTTGVETSGPAGQQMLNFYKSSFGKPAGSSSSSLSEAAKSAESLTKNIPAGTTVTVKTIENKSASSSGKTSPSSALATAVSTSSSSPAPPSSPKSSPFRMSMSSAAASPFANGGTKTIANPYASMAAVTQASLMNPFVHSMALAAQQAQYLNFSNQPFGAAAALAAAQMEAANFVAANTAAANFVRAAQAAAQLSSQSAAVSASPLTTLEFTKPNLGGHLADDRYGGLKIPQPTVSRSLSSFGTSRLQVKVNADSPPVAADKAASLAVTTGPYSSATTTTTSSASSSIRESGSPSQLTNGSANKHVVGTHAMPAILPFHGVKKVQALPKSAGQTARPPALAALGGGGGAKSPAHSSPPPPGTAMTFAKSPATTPTIANTSSNSSPVLNTIQSLTDSNPFKTSGPVTASSPVNKTGSNSSPFSASLFTKAPTPAIPPTGVNNPFKPALGGGPTSAPNNSLKKLAADLNTAQQKALLKGDNNILNALKKSNSGENKLADFVGGGKGFGKAEVKKAMEAGGGGGGRKEVTTSS